MELRQLKYFAKVAELKSFSRASEMLYVSQSTLSQQVRQLEAELGATLLQRDSHRVELTDLGRAFLPSALRTLSEAAIGQDSILNIKELRAGELNIGSTFTFSLLLDIVVREFINRYPGVKLNIFCQKMDELMNALDQGEIDLALSYRSKKCYPNIDSHILFDNQLAVVVSESHPLAHAKAVALEELQHYKLALPMRGMQARNAFESIIADHNLKFNIQLETDELTILLGLIASTHMVTLVSQATAHYHHGLVAVPLKDVNVPMEGCYHLRSGSHMKYATRAFVEHLEENKNLGIIGMM